MNQKTLPCRNCGGEGTVTNDRELSEGHVITVTEQCGLCNGAGWEHGDAITCDNCDGTGTEPMTRPPLDCSYCHGDGYVLVYRWLG